MYSQMFSMISTNIQLIKSWVILTLLYQWQVTTNLNPLMIFNPLATSHIPGSITLYPAYSCIYINIHTITLISHYRLISQYKVFDNEILSIYPPIQSTRPFWIDIHPLLSMICPLYWNPFLLKSHYIDIIWHSMCFFFNPKKYGECGEFLKWEIPKSPRGF